MQIIEEDRYFFVSPPIVELDNGSFQGVESIKCAHIKINRRSFVYKVVKDQGIVDQNLLCTWQMKFYTVTWIGDKLLAKYKVTKSLKDQSVEIKLLETIKKDCIEEYRRIWETTSLKQIDNHMRNGKMTRRIPLTK